MAKTATITVDYFDENNDPKQMVTTAQYEIDVDEDLITIEYLSPENSGPLMRPKTPRA